ncbi:hypothetical protein B7463_g7320, partial [Scytalidium lignicola]
MAPNLRREMVEAIENALLNSDDDKYTIAITFDVSYETVRYIAQGIQLCTIVGLDIGKHTGRPSIVTPEIEEAVIKLVAMSNEIFQDEITDFVYDEFNVQLSQSMISRLLKKLDISYKKLEIIIAQRNQHLINN